MTASQPPILIDTDQLRCYDAAGHELGCADSKQDAEYPKLVLLDASRFHSKGETVLDVATGAVWAKNANPADFPLSWEEAQAFAANMAASKAYGLGNWQLPSRRLLFSLLSHQNINPALPSGAPFSGVVSSYYWTADSCSRFPHQAWHIHLGGARAARANKADGAMLWPVCPPEAAQAALGPRFALMGETVEDKASGLIWTRDAGLSPNPLSWEEALGWIKDLNSHGYCGARDWRMPNVRELESLTDTRRDSPALPADHPFVDVREAYWTSTTSVYESRYAWVLYLQDGMVGVGFKPGRDFFLWPVRGGR